MQLVHIPPMLLHTKDDRICNYITTTFGLCMSYYHKMHLPDKSSVNESCYQSAKDPRLYSWMDCASLGLGSLTFSMNMCKGSISATVFYQPIGQNRPRSMPLQVIRVRNCGRKSNNLQQTRNTWNFQMLANFLFTQSWVTCPWTWRLRLLIVLLLVFLLFATIKLRKLLRCKHRNLS